MTTLNTYITDVRRLLHDANGNFWTDAELTDYINTARYQLVRDTGCNRALQSTSTVAQQETYAFSSLPKAGLTLDILNVTIYWGNSRIPLYYMPWTQFNAELRVWQNYYGRPVAFSMYGPNTIYLSPNPDQVYQMELDTVCMVDPLVTGSDVEVLANYWTEPVQYYAAHKAKYKEQSYGEAEIFKQVYVKRVQEIITGNYTRRLPDPYSIPM
jgi:hypothetical protein